MKKIICLFGGPGVGKSTVCAGLFYRLKQKGYNCEMVREYVKDWAWEGREIKEESDHLYASLEQVRKEQLYVRVGLDYIITDAPLPLVYFYSLKKDKLSSTHLALRALFYQQRSFCSLYGYTFSSFLLNRAKPYNRAGRYQTEEQALKYDIEIRQLLTELNIKYKETDGNEQAVEFILNVI